MGRIAVLQSTGDDVEKIFPAIGAALGAVGSAMGGAAMAGGRALATGAGKLMGGAKNIASRGLSGAKNMVTEGAKKVAENPLQSAKVAFTGKEDPSAMDVMGTINDKKATAEARRQASLDGAMENAKRGAEIVTGTANKSEPMKIAWTLLKNRMEVGPHEEQQDELFNHLKNLSGNHRIHTNEDDNSFMVDDVHDSDKDVVRRLIESFGRSFTNNEEPHMADMKEEKTPHFF